MTLKKINVKLFNFVKKLELSFLFFNFLVLSWILFIISEILLFFSFLLSAIFLNCPNKRFLDRNSRNFFLTYFK